MSNIFNEEYQSMQLILWALAAKRERIQQAHFDGWDLNKPTLRGDNVKDSPLTFLMKRKEWAAAAVLLESGANPNSCWRFLDEAGEHKDFLQSHMFNALFNQSHPQKALAGALAYYVTKGDLNNIEVLLELGANPEQPYNDHHNSTSLELAKIIDDRHQNGEKVVQLLESFIEKKSLEKNLTYSASKSSSKLFL